MILKRLQQIFKRTEAPAPAEREDDITVPCCSENVHIAYRGKSDDRMYMAYNRTWQEVRYFQTEGLRVFCAVCRRRVY